MSIPDEPWRQEAACRAADTALFFGFEEDQERAVAICRGSCPVMIECREYAVATRRQDGVWGGLTEEQLRRRVKRPRAEPDHGTTAGARQHNRLGERPCRACREAANAAHRAS